jgi:hypothetical protein
MRIFRQALAGFRIQSGQFLWLARSNLEAKTTKREMTQKKTGWRLVAVSPANQPCLFLFGSGLFQKIGGAGVLASRASPCPSGSRGRPPHQTAVAPVCG